MIDLLISDYTLNTLLYHFHRKGIFAFRIGPEIPVIGDLLNLTCTAEDIDFDLSFELQDNKDFTNETASNETNSQTKSQDNRKRRHTAMDTLINFGICLGDIAPGIRERNPGKRTYIIIKTNRAPSVLFQNANKGTIVIEFIIDGLIFLDGTNIKVGHLQIRTVSAIVAQLIANRIVGKVQIERMEFIDIDKTFGLPSEAFTNLSDLARGILTRAINKKLANGIPLTMPQLGLPIQFSNLHFQVIEHALFISTDVSIPSLTYYSPYQRFTGCPYYYQIL
ncbi:LBP / BPI / CETP family C-terminal domain protein [Brugia pahangi]